MSNSVDSTSKGWMPEAAMVPVPFENFSAGNQGRKAAVLHLTQGSAKSAKDRFQNPGQRVSAHFLVLRTGEIWQFVSVVDTAYANGLSWNAAQKCWIDPEGNLLKPPHAPTWLGLTPPTNPNFQTISVERELLSTSEQPSDAQNAAVVRILQYLHTLFPTSLASWIPLQTLIGHCHISPIERAFCPGPKCNYQALADAANGAPPPPVSRAYQVTGLPIYQRQDLTGPLAGVLPTGETVLIDQTYSNGGGHLKDGRGFVNIDGLKSL